VVIKYMDIPLFEHEISLVLSFDENKHPRDKEGKFKTYYHGSPNPNIEVLKAGSYVTKHLYIAKIMGIHNKRNKKVWNDKDLTKPYKFGSKIKFKSKNKFSGKPIIYKLEVKDEDIDFLNNPFEHTIKVPIKVIKLI